MSLYLFAIAQWLLASLDAQDDAFLLACATSTAPEAH